MDNIKFFSDNINICDKTIILRLDLNVPIFEKEIQDETRILINLPFLKNLLEKKAKVIIISHLGRPKGLRSSSLSLTPVYKFLKKHLKNNVYFFTGDINNKETKEESENDDNFAKILASLGDLYINDAFSCSHRKQASIHKITKYIKDCYGGPLLKKEIFAINSILHNKKEPVTCIIGGSKISTKINVIINLIKNVNNIVIVGAMANNFLIYGGFKIGKSLVEKNSNETIKKIYSEALKYKCKIYIPEDANVAKDLKGSGKVKKLDLIDQDDIILDIGPNTINTIKQIIDNSNMVLWNGPAGYFENINFADGTLAIAKKISENTNNKSLVSILGGGDTISAINKDNSKFSFTHLSTAGGAFLEFLEGKDLPGISVLK